MERSGTLWRWNLDWRPVMKWVCDKIQLFLWGLLLLLCGLFVVWCFGGCGGGKVVLPPANPTPTVEDIERQVAHQATVTDTIAVDLQAIANRIKAIPMMDYADLAKIVQRCVDLAATIRNYTLPAATKAKTEIADLKTHDDAATKRADHYQKIVDDGSWKLYFWGSAILAVLALACVAGAYFLKSKLCIMGAAVFGIAAAALSAICANWEAWLTIGSIVLYVLLALFLCAVGIGAYLLFLYAKGLTQAVKTAAVAKDMLDPQQTDTFKATANAIQTGAAGAVVKKTVDKVNAEVKKVTGNK